MGYCGVLLGDRGTAGGAAGVGQALLGCCWAAEELYWEVAPMARAAGMLLGAAGPATRLPADPMLL